MRAALLAGLLLAGCAAVAPSYRDASAPIASIAALDAARFAGTWHEVARFPVPFQAGCTDTTATYTLRADGALDVENACLRDGRREVIRGVATPDGPGRFAVRLDGVPVAAAYWVLWVDEGYRTAVVGVPSGRAGWILNRTPDIPPDRLAAAREILDFYGFDLGRLETTPQAGS